MAKKSRQILLDDSLQPYVDKIVVLFNQMSTLRGESPNLSTILAYLYIFKQITQSQLKKFTGISRGTISATLNMLMQFNVLERKIIPGTHTNLYLLKLDMNQISSQGLQRRANSTQDLMQFFLSIKNRIQSIAEKKYGITSMENLQEFINEEQDLKKISLLWNRSKQINAYFQTYIDLIKKTAKSEFDHNVIPEQTSKKFNMQSISTLDGLEDKIIDHLSNSSLFKLWRGASGTKSGSLKFSHTISLIIAHLILNETLTQKRLQNLTGFSAGTISQDLSYLEEKIRIVESWVDPKDPRARRRLYKIHPMGEVLKSAIQSSAGVLINIFQEFTNIKSDLESKKHTFEKINGYTKIMEFLDEFTTLFQKGLQDYK
ncbi:MAG: hypothetical protein GF364_14090 [Candidatus Lokiarchaeota archaeon]|nr:hypothetical protein [Candidatus Lokiarchaeota archaeon]